MLDILRNKEYNTGKLLDSKNFCKGSDKLADRITLQVADYVDKLGINMKALSRGTSISYGVLQRSLMTKTRDLRADELLEICGFLGKDPLDFAASEKGGESA